jgi:large subunit ribosomal protein L10
MSKPVKEMIVKDYVGRLDDASEALVLSLRGVDSKATESLRKNLRSKSVRVTIVKNSLARKAFAGTALDALSPVLKGQNAVLYGDRSVVEVAREIIELVKKVPQIELKGAVLDGELFSGEDGIKRLSTFPTRDEAIGQTVTLILSPARRLARQVISPGGKLAGCIKAIEEKLEKGEAIARV